MSTGIYGKKKEIRLSAEASSVSRKEEKKIDESRFDLSIGRSLITTPGFILDGQQFSGIPPRVRCLENKNDYIVISLRLP